MSIHSDSISETDFNSTAELYLLETEAEGQKKTHEGCYDETEISDV